VLNRGIEPRTRGFSNHRSTNELKQHGAHAWDRTRALSNIVSTDQADRLLGACSRRVIKPQDRYVIPHSHTEPLIPLSYAGILSLIGLSLVGRPYYHTDH
jgi:hypothetical protein